MKILHTEKYGDLDVTECEVLNRLFPFVAAFEIHEPERSNPVITQSYIGQRIAMANPLIQYDDMLRVKMDVVATSIVKRTLGDYILKYYASGMYAFAHNVGVNEYVIDWTFRSLTTGRTLDMKRLKMNIDKRMGTLYRIECTFDWFTITYDEPVLTPEDFEYNRPVIMKMRQM